MTNAITNFMGQGFVGTKSGNVYDSKKGEGTFTVTKTLNENGSKTTDKSVTYADGTTHSSSRTTTTNEDGSKTVQVAKTDKDGNVTMVQKNRVKNEDGTVSVTGTATLSSGMVVEIAGLISKSEDGKVSDVTFTKEDGTTRTSHTKSTYNEETGELTKVSDNINYKGKEKHRETNWVVTA